MQIQTFVSLLSQYKVKTHLPITEISAAVMILIIEKHGELFLLITKRPDSIATYAGDFCFPGGVKDRHDKDLRQTAEREVEEELNLPSSEYTYVTQLDDVRDRYGNIVRPFVSVISYEHFEKTYRLSHDEVESIYLLPLQEIKEFKRDTHLESSLHRTPLYSYTHDNVFIWGLTARIIVLLHDILYDA